MDFAVVMDEGQVLALFIRIGFLHSHHRTSETGTSRLATKGCVVLGLVEAYVVHLIGEYVFSLGPGDGQVQPSQ